MIKSVVLTDGEYCMRGTVRKDQYCFNRIKVVLKGDSGVLVIKLVNLVSSYYNDLNSELYSHQYFFCYLLRVFTYI